MRAPRLPELVLVLVVLAGAYLRFAALDFGLPDRFRPDEQYVIEHAARLGDGRGFNPHFATYPALAAWLAGRLIDVPYSFTAHAHDIFLDQLYLATLSRYPTDSEKASAVTYLRSGVLGQKAEDLQWVLLNSLEFLFD